jgi:hypothetical protein
MPFGFFLTTYLYIRITLPIEKERVHYLWPRYIDNFLSFFFIRFGAVCTFYILVYLISRELSSERIILFNMHRLMWHLKFLVFPNHNIFHYLKWKRLFFFLHFRRRNVREICFPHFGYSGQWENHFHGMIGIYLTLFILYNIPFEILYLLQQLLVFLSTISKG